MKNDPTIPENWYLYAKRDLERAHKRLAEEDVECMIFHCQQCAEKMMKGWLISHGWKLIYSHDLMLLTKATASYGCDLQWFEESADTLSKSYVSLRYPFLSDDIPSHAEAELLLHETEKLVAQLLPTP